jgi:hypothetical protein
MQKRFGCLAAWLVAMGRSIQLRKRRQVRVSTGPIGSSRYCNVRRRYMRTTKRTVNSQRRSAVGSVRMGFQPAAPPRGIG